MTDALRQQVVGILTEEGVPVLESDKERIVIRAPAEDASTSLSIEFGETDDGLPWIQLYAPVLVELEATDEARLKVLEAVNRTNTGVLFGALAYFEAEKAIFFKHSLFGAGLEAKSFVRLLGMIAGTADELDDALLKEIGAGKRTRDQQSEQQAAEA